MEKAELKNLIMKSKGEQKSELVLKNFHVVNVFTNEIIIADVAIDRGKVVGIGEYQGLEEVDLKGKYIAPGFIDSHVHIESSMSIPSQFARAIIPRGVTSIVADPHEIANVRGIEGIKFMIDDSKNTPLDVYFVLPSCVPATSFENSGAILDADDLRELMNDENVIGLGEMMNYPGVLTLDDKVLDKLVLGSNKIIDGHGPMITDKDLNAYVVAGIKTEHESSTLKEVQDRLRLGMYILIREGSATKDLNKIISAVNKDNLNRFLFCTDDKHPEDLIRDGSIDFNIKLAIKNGVEPVDAIKIATINAALAYNLKGKGAIAPGYDADLVVLDNLEDLNILRVYKHGKIVAKDYKALFESKSYSPKHMKNSVHLNKITEDDLKIKMKGNLANTIKIIPHSIVTGKAQREVLTIDGYFAYSDNDISKLVVIERHKLTGNIGIGLIENFKLKDGAIGTTIAHDSHNIIIVGDNDRDIISVVEHLNDIGGGLAIASKGEIIKSLTLEIGGIMTSKDIEQINESLKEMMDISYDKLKVNREIDPFMTLSFMALPVIPKLKLTDMGLFDVEDFEFIDVSVRD